MSMWRRSALTLLLGAAASPAAWADFAATVRVDTGEVRATMSPRGLGMHTSPYYNGLGNNWVDDRLEEAGVTTLRYGGGGYADVLHWSIAQPQWVNGITGGGLSPWWGEEGNFGYVGPGSDFGTFVGLLDQTDNSQAVVTVNYGSALKLVDGQSVVPDYGGQPEEAAAWVAYANADPAIYGTPNDIPIGLDQQGNDWKTAGYWARLRASTGSQYQAWASADGVYEPLNRFLAIDRDAPVGVQHWEIGNETFGTGYYGGGRGYSANYNAPYNVNRDDHPALSPARYGQDLVEYAQLMRSIDPTIQIGAVLATPPDDYDWSYADLNDNGRRDAGEAHWNDEVLANAAHEIDFVVVHWYPWAGENADGSALLAEVPAKIGRMIDGSTPGLDTGDDAGLRDSLAAYGIPDAEIMVTEFNFFGSLANQHEDPAKALYAADAYASWLERGVDSVDFLELFRGDGDFLNENDPNHRGPSFYGVSLVDRLAKPGDAFVEADSTSGSVRAHAAVQADGSVAVMLLNTSLTETATIDLDIDGVTLTGEGVLHSLVGGDTLSTSLVTGQAGGVSATLGPRAALVYVLETLAGDFNADGLVDAADYVVWRNGLGTAYTQADLADWRANYGASVGDPSSSVPEPTGLACLLIAAGGLLARRAT